MGNQGKVVLITGAAGNLGRAAAEAFERTGARLVLVDIDQKGLEAAYPGNADNRLLKAANLLDEASIMQAADAARAKFGRIDVLCNIAGGFYWGEPVHETKADVWKRMIDLNATTMINAVKSVVPKMVEAGSGTVINIGTAANAVGHAHMSAYAAGKGAVMRLTESMGEELRDKGVSVFCVMPNIIDTPQNRTDMPTADFSGWTPPSAIANVILLLTSDAAALMSGNLFPLNGRVKA